MIGEKLPERAARHGRELMDGLRAMQSPLVKEVRGRGYLIGVELTKPAGPLMDACREHGLLVLTAGEKVLRLAPPLVAGPAEITRALDILKDVLAKAGG
jgi:acetylornithine/succinyldiaminopimelate/putrescine aminotransferase